MTYNEVKAPSLLASVLKAANLDGQRRRQLVRIAFLAVVAIAAVVMATYHLLH